MAITTIFANNIIELYYLQYVWSIDFFNLPYNPLEA